MTQSEDDLSRLKAAYAAWHRTRGQSVETWLALLAEVVDFRSLADGQHGVPWTRTRTSPAEVRDYLAGLTATFAMEHYTVERYVAEGDTIVAIGSTAWRNRANGKRFETPKVDLWRFRDGKIVAYFEYYDTAAVAAAASP